MSIENESSIKLMLVKLGYNAVNLEDIRQKKNSVKEVQVVENIVPLLSLGRSGRTDDLFPVRPGERDMQTLYLSFSLIIN
jgi:hypothetical protein